MSMWGRRHSLASAEDACGRTRGPRLAIAALVTLAAALACGPIGPLSGGRLGGTVHADPPADWAAAAEADTVQLETRPDDPYSVNVWCGVLDGRLYVPTSLILGPDDPAEREWVRNVEADPRVRLRIDDDVYELRAVRVEDAGEREAARAMLMQKYEVEADEHSEMAWLYRLEARTGGAAGG